MKRNPELTVRPLAGLPMFAAGMSIAQAICASVEAEGDRFRDGDILVVAQKIVSKVEGRTRDLASYSVSEEAQDLAQVSARDPRLMQAILEESSQVLRRTPTAVIAAHRTGHVLANAGIDASNVEGGETGRILLWPSNPDVSARELRKDLQKMCQVRLGVVIADSMGRAWRIGTLGTAIGCAGVTVLEDLRGRGSDLYGRTLQATVIGIADSIAAMAGLAMGEGAEGTPAALVRGCGRWVGDEDGLGAASALRPVEQDMFR